MFTFVLLVFVMLGFRYPFVILVFVSLVINLQIGHFFVNSRPWDPRYQE